MSLLTTYPELQAIHRLAQKRKIKVFLVGGFLRDFFLGRPKGDFDFAVNQGSLSLAQNFSRSIKGAYIVLDRQRGTARVAKRKDGQVYTFDFADFRQKTLSGDLAHRDFTINTLCLDLRRLEKATNLQKALIDKKGGLKDIRNQKIRMTSARIFKEDPLRLLRAFSLQVLAGFRIDLKTLNQIKKDRALLPSVSYERIRDEFFKILSSEKAAEILALMDRVGILEKVIPQIKIMEDCFQGGYHHLDVWPHSLETVRQLEKVILEAKTNPDASAYLDERLSGERRRFALMKLAALLHDIGKPETKKVEKDRMSFHGHERVGKTIVHHIAVLLKLSLRERHMLEDMVLWHLRPGYLSNFQKPSERMIFRYFRDAKEEGASILWLSLADQRSTRGPLTTQADQEHHERICLGLGRRFFEKKKEKTFVRLINGTDLINEIKLKPGPIFARILKSVEEQQVLGKIETKSEALELAREMSLKFKLG